MISEHCGQNFTTLSNLYQHQREQHGYETHNLLDKNGIQPQTLGDLIFMSLLTDNFRKSEIISGHMKKIEL